MYLFGAIKFASPAHAGVYIIPILFVLMIFRQSKPEDISGIKPVAIIYIFVILASLIPASIKNISSVYFITYACH